MDTLSRTWGAEAVIVCILYRNCSQRVVKRNSTKFWLGVGLRVKSEISGSRGCQVAAAHLLLRCSKASLRGVLNKWLSATRITNGIHSLHLVPRLVVLVTLEDLLKLKVQGGF